MENINRKIIVLLFCVFLFLLPLSASEGWKVLQHTDEFGDTIDEWFALNIIDDAVMSNSATSASDAVIVFKVESPLMMQIQCHDYGLHNAAKEFYLDDKVYYSFKDDMGKVRRLSKDTEYGSSDFLVGFNAIAIRDMMLNSKYIKVSISGDKSKYVFTVDTDGFREILVDLCKKQLYTDCDIDDILDTETSIYNYIFDELLRQMNPYTSDKSDFNTSVYDFMIKYRIDEMREVFPEYYDAVMSRFKSKTYEEWINYFSTYYSVDITRIKEMASVEKVFSLLGVSITKLGQTREIVAIDNIENGEEDKFDSFDKLMEAAGVQLPPLPNTRYAEKSLGYFYLRSYGLGLSSLFGTNPISNNFSFGIAGGFGGPLEHKSPHCLFGEIAWLYNGKHHAFEEALSYAYRKGIGLDLEMLIKIGFDFNMKSGLVKTSYSFMYEGGITTGFLCYLGVNLGLQFNYFMNPNLFITFGVGDRILAPGFSLIGDKEIDAGVDNLLEVFVGIGTSF